ncbi:pyridoxal phosphate-dependent aminotransferase [Hydrogenophaga intermedia]|uniref:pyridoxal phosphate-dependent aminotransferase n=1 Tax=Hydrogenophaga intermedia TaxID=65786 RepID=UPI002044BCED|nr:pyridoxal phosphate-dependent aminotransferase [Hydrogenophaga intermedia]
MTLLNTPVVGKRTALMTPIGVERMGDVADTLNNPDVLRLENLDTDLLPPQVALDTTREQVLDDDANSYLPFFGHDSLRRAATALVERNGGLPAGTYNWKSQCFISAGGLSGVLNALLAVIEPGDEVVMTSPTYVGLINRVLLAGGVPRYIPMKVVDGEWRLETGAIAGVVTERTKAFLMMSPSMPTGATFNRHEWEAICAACVQANAWMIYDSAMERILFDGAPRLNPLHFPGMQDRTITVGAASKEYRMIGWRVGWIVTPIAAAEALSRAALGNVVCTVGIAQQAVARAIEAPDDGIERCTREWQARHDYIVRVLRPKYEVVAAKGGWSLLVDVSRHGLTGAEASRRLLAEGVAATSMENWGLENTRDYVRLVFANEPVLRLSTLAERFQRAIPA